MIFNGNKQKYLTQLNNNEIQGNFLNYLLKEKELYEISDKIISVTNYMKDFLIGQYNINKEKILVVPNGIEDYSHHILIDKGFLKKSMVFLLKKK